MSASGSSSKSVRTYGHFAPESSASSLFDAAFSKPIVRRRSEKTQISNSNPAAALNDEPLLPSVSDSQDVGRRDSPKQVFSPPVSIPESNSTDGALDNENEDQTSSSSEDDRDVSGPSHSQSNGDMNSQASSTSSLRRRLDNADISSQSSVTKDLSDGFDFVDEEESTPPPSKKVKPDSSVNSKDSSSTLKLVASKERRPVYQHKWADDDEDEEDTEDNNIPTPRFFQSSSLRQQFSGTTNSSISAQHYPVYSRPTQSGARVKNVKEAHQCLESGEHDDFKQDLEYLLSAMTKSEGSINVKCLSAISLADKCIRTEFRQFVRGEGLVKTLFRALSDASEHQGLALCASTILYLMSRDQVPMPVDAQTLRLLTQLLKVDKMDDDAEQKKYINKIKEVFVKYVAKASEGLDKPFKFDFSLDDLTPSILALESLVYILSPNTAESLKSELLTLGALQWVVTKVEKTVVAISSSDIDEIVMRDHLLLLEKCFHILEACTFLHKKNQAYLISHRGSVLIHMCGKLTQSIHTSISACGVGSVSATPHMICLAAVARVLMNLSHENELCCTKLGQLDGFLPLCLSACTFLAPKFAPDDKKFDLLVMMTSLLVNLVERCNANRRKVIDTNVTVYLGDSGSEEELPALDALVKLFIYHESKAKSVDEDLDRDLAFEEAIEEGSDNEEEEEIRADGRLDRGKLEGFGELEMMLEVQKAMNKASEHMEDSMSASYLALLIGCLLQQNEERAANIRSQLDNNSFVPMYSQLERFLDFMRMAKKKKDNYRSIERIIDLFQKLEMS